MAAVDSEQYHYGTYIHMSTSWNIHGITTPHLTNMVHIHVSDIKH